MLQDVKCTIWYFLGHGIYHVDARLAWLLEVDEEGLDDVEIVCIFGGGGLSKFLYEVDKVFVVRFLRSGGRWGEQVFEEFVDKLWVIIE